MKRAAAPAAAVGVQRLVIEPLDPKLVTALSANGRSQSHWPRTNARAKVMSMVYLLALTARWRPFTVPVRATFRWIVPTKGRRDLDNLASNGIVKAALDAFVKHKYLTDDSSEHVVEVRTEMTYEKGVRALEITLEPVEAQP